MRRSLRFGFPAFLLASGLAHAASVDLVFDVSVDQCSGLQCGAFEPTRFQQTWTISGLQSGPIARYVSGSEVLERRRISGIVQLPSAPELTPTALSVSGVPASATYGTIYLIQDLYFVDGEFDRAEVSSGFWAGASVLEGNRFDSYVAYMTGSASDVLPIEYAGLSAALVSSMLAPQQFSWSDMAHMSDHPRVEDFIYTGTASFVSLSLSPVPEPGVSVMYLLGLTALGIFMRSKRGNSTFQEGAASC